MSRSQRLDVFTGFEVGDTRLILGETKSSVVGDAIGDADVILIAIYIYICVCATQLPVW